VRERERAFPPSAGSREREKNLKEEREREKVRSCERNELRETNELHENVASRWNVSPKRLHGSNPSVLESTAEPREMIRDRLRLDASPAPKKSRAGRIETHRAVGSKFPLACEQRRRVGWPSSGESVGKRGNWERGKSEV